MDIFDLMLLHNIAIQKEFTTAEGYRLIEMYILINKGQKIVCKPEPKELEKFEQAVTIAAAFFSNDPTEILMTYAQRTAS